MSNVRTKQRQPHPGARVRAFRESQALSLDALADQVKGAGAKRRPSIAKLSRIETGLQPIPTDILESLAKVTNIPAVELRPDLAAMFGKAGAAA
jgi:transcriptional regulator with XRE-family HTH domain